MQYMTVLGLVRLNSTSFMFIPIFLFYALDILGLATCVRWGHFFKKSSSSANSGSAALNQHTRTKANRTAMAVNL